MGRESDNAGTGGGLHCGMPNPTKTLAILVFGGEERNLTRIGPSLPLADCSDGGKLSKSGGGASTVRGLMMLQKMGNGSGGALKV